MPRRLTRSVLLSLVLAVAATMPGVATATDPIHVMADPSPVLYDPITASPEGVFGGQIRGILIPRFGPGGLIGTKYGIQSDSPAALATRARVEAGARLYRIGTLKPPSVSALGEAQFWLLENPATLDPVADLGFPSAKAAQLDFIESGYLKKGTPFVTREIALGGGRTGTLIEVITTGDPVSPRGVEALETFSTLELKPDAKGVFRVDGELKGRGRRAYGRSSYSGPGRRLAASLRAMDMPSAERLTRPGGAESPGGAAEPAAAQAATEAPVAEPAGASMVETARPAEGLNLTSLRRVGGARIPYTPSIGGAMMGVSFALHASKEGLVPTVVGAGVGVVAWEVGTRATVWAVGAAARVGGQLIAGRAAGVAAGRLATRLGTRAIPIVGELLLAGDIALFLTNRIAGYDATWGEVWDAWTGKLDKPTNLPGLPGPPDQAFYIE